jgi:hypothetical protein
MDESGVFVHELGVLSGEFVIVVDTICLSKGLESTQIRLELGDFFSFAAFLKAIRFFV